MKLDILAFAAHPDDVEISCSGVLAKHSAQGDKIGIVDLTQGEMGTRGTPELRLEEAQKSAEILGLSSRENLGFADAFFKNDLEHQTKIVEKIRKYRPAMVLANAISDRHPDHGKAAELVQHAVFLAGLKKFETKDEDGNKQEPWHIKTLLHYIQSIPIKPDFVVDVSDYWDVRMKSMKAFASQFYDPNSSERETYISNPRFMKMIEARAMEYGQIIGCSYAEGFTTNRYLGLKDLNSVL